MWRRIFDWGTAVALMGVLLTGAGFAYAVVHAQGLPEGPQAVLWGEDICTQCRQRMTEKLTAAQLLLKDGRVLHFDNPGCLFRYLSDREPPMAAAWFHHHQAERWLESHEVGFVPQPGGWMGSGLGATDARTPGAISFQTALMRAGEGHPGCGGVQHASNR